MKRSLKKWILRAISLSSLSVAKTNIPNVKTTIHFSAIQPEKREIVARLFFKESIRPFYSLLHWPDGARKICCVSDCKRKAKRIKMSGDSLFVYCRTCFIKDK